MDAATNILEVILHRSPFYMVTVFLICILLGLFRGITTCLQASVSAP